MLEVNTETTNTNSAPAENAEIPATSPQGESQVVPENKPETPPKEETLYSIKYRGQEEKLPLDKLIGFAQQGRDYSEKMGQFNTMVESRAKELADAALDKFYEEQAAERVGATPENNRELPPLDDDKLSTLEKEIQALKEKDEKEALEREVSKQLEDINKSLDQAVKDFPLADRGLILATLRSQPNADIRKLSEHFHNKEKERRDAWEKDYLAQAEERGRRGAEGAGGGTTTEKPTKLKLGVNTLEAAQEFLSKT